MESFNVRGLSEHYKKEELEINTNRYNANVCCLQETKIKHATSYRLNSSIFITFLSDNKHYGNSFVIAKKWKNSILQLQPKTSSEGKEALYKSERISVTRIKISNFTTENKYKVEKVSDTKLKHEKVNPNAKHIINIINGYARTS